MSGRNRRRTPASADDARRILSDLERLVPQLEREYLALLGSGYTKPHRKAGDQLGDPAGMVSGTPKAVRVFLTRAAEGFDQAHEGVLQARYWLARIVTLLDEHAPTSGADEDLPTASAAEVRQAQKQQARRNERAGSSALPWARDEVTG